MATQQNLVKSAKNKKKASPKKQTIKIEWVRGPGSRFTDEDIQVLGPLLEQLCVKNGGKLTQKALLEEAEANPASPLWKFLELDDKKAARKYRLEQCRKIIQAIRYRVETPDGVIEARTFEIVNVTNEIPDATPGRGYVHQSTIVQHQTLSDQILERAAKELRQWKDRFATHTRYSLDLRAIFEAIDQWERQVFGKK